MRGNPLPWIKGKEKYPSCFFTSKITIFSSHVPFKKCFLASSLYLILFPPQPGTKPRTQLHELRLANSSLTLDHFVCKICCHYSLNHQREYFNQDNYLWTSFRLVEMMSLNSQFIFFSTCLFIAYTVRLVCRILVPQPGIELWQWKHRVLITGPQGNPLDSHFLFF